MSIDVRSFRIGLLLIVCAWSGLAQAQDDGFGGLLGPGSSLNSPARPARAAVQATAVLVPAETPDQAVLQVRLVIPEGANTYSQNPAFEKPLEITLADGANWTVVDSAFIADQPVKTEYDQSFMKEVEKYFGAVVFSRRVRIPDGVNLADASLNGRVSLLVCDDNNCRPQRLDFVAAYAESPLAPIPVAAAPAGEATQAEAFPRFAYQITPKRGKRDDTAQLQFELTPSNPQAGDEVLAAITMMLPDNWSAYDVIPADDTQIERPTEIVFNAHNLRAVGEIVSVPEPTIHVTTLPTGEHRSRSFSHRVTWIQKFEAIEAGPIGLDGTIRYQICEKEQSCLPPLRVKFSLGSVQNAEDVAAARPAGELFAQASSAPAESNEADLIGSLTGGPTNPNAGAKTQDTTLGGALVLAFIAGLIMNIMPCVLPVLAIKILSLVQQAGESRARIVGLNLAYTAGVLTVFFAFAFLSWGLGQTLGGIFQNETFITVMACVVFTMALSLFGVFELPVPGLIPSASDHQEGYAGAFNTGIVATLLGTPCIGPFVVGFFTWTLKQPAPVVFLVFGTMGLGMAFPYLMTGFFPSLVNWLPRPGMWMVRFKQFTGFVMMGTVIWLLFSIDMALRIPVLVLLLSLAFFLWSAHNFTNPADPLGKKLIPYLIALGAATPVALCGLWMMREFEPVGTASVAAADGDAKPKGSSHKLPWQPFSEELLLELRQAGTPMLIDFTANWCAICKSNELLALNTSKTAAFVKEHGFVPLMADFTKESPEIQKWINQFQFENVPLTVIIPPGRESQAITLGGMYTQGHLLKMLQEAVEQGARASAVQTTSGKGTTDAPALVENKSPSDVSRID